MKLLGFLSGQYQGPTKSKKKHNSITAQNMNTAVSSMINLIVSHVHPHTPTLFCLLPSIWCLILASMQHTKKLQVQTKYFCKLRWRKKTASKVDKRFSWLFLYMLFITKWEKYIFIKKLNIHNYCIRFKFGSFNVNE